MKHVFTMEQEEYLSENITWNYIHYTDNQPILDMLALKPMSIMSLLDEESRFPQASVFTPRVSPQKSSNSMLLGVVVNLITCSRLSKPLSNKAQINQTFLLSTTPTGRLPVRTWTIFQWVKWEGWQTRSP